jgi:uncharacterized protein with HEPN domain
LFKSNFLREINSIPSILKGYNQERFLQSEKTQKAVCMTLLNIGELVKALSDELKADNTAVPWRQIAGLRDLAAHQYHSLNMERIWITAKIDLSSLKLAITRILNHMKESG